MEADSDQTNESYNSTKSSIDSNISDGSILLSPLGRSRYGRARKQKIREDFYDIDAVLDSVKDAKKSPRANTQQLKSPQANSTPLPVKKLKSLKAKHFVHVTGDSVEEGFRPTLSSSSTRDALLNNNFNKIAQRKFFKRDKTESSSQVMNKFLSDSDVNQLTIDATTTTTTTTSITDDSVDVIKVLKIISTKSSPDGLQNNVDMKGAEGGNVKAVLKTYSNKRKRFRKNFESFALPDTPIFPIENNKQSLKNEPKRIKDLDLATQCSESDVNIVDKKLLETPWKITSMTSDFPNNQILLETYCEESPTIDDFSGSDEDKSLINDIKIPSAVEKDETAGVEIKNKIKSPRKQLVKKASFKFSKKQLMVDEKDKKDKMKLKATNVTITKSLKNQILNEKVDKVKLSEKEMPSSPKKQLNYDDKINKIAVVNLTRKQLTSGPYVEFEKDCLVEHKKKQIVKTKTLKKQNPTMESAKNTKKSSEANENLTKTTPKKLKPNPSTFKSSPVLASARILRSVNSPSSSLITSPNPKCSVSPRKVDSKVENVEEMKKSVELKHEIKEEMESIDELDDMNLSERIRLINMTNENSFHELKTSMKRETQEVSMENFNKADKITLKRGRSKKSVRTKSAPIIPMKTEPMDIKLGDIMWAKVGSHPYWPCLVTNDPSSGNYKKFHNTKSHLFHVYHVRFFGDRGRRSWVSNHLILPYNDRDDLKNLDDKLKNSTSSNNVSVLSPYIIKPNKLKKWQNAVEEAESVKSSSIDERFDFFFNMFATKKERKERLSIVENPKSIVKRKRGRPRHVKVKMESDLTNSVNLTQDLLESFSEMEERKYKKRKIKDNDEANAKRIAIPDESEIAIETSKQPKKRFNKPTDSNLNVNNNNNLHMQKSNSRKVSCESSIDERSDMFLKHSWQVLDISKRPLSTPFNEVNSEYSLSDTDSLSKSSGNVPVSNTYQEYVARYKKYNLFRKVSRNKVCQICQKPGSVLRCKGPCNGLFHYNCGSEISAKSENLAEISKTDEIETPLSTTTTTATKRKIKKSSTKTNNNNKKNKQNKKANNNNKLEVVHVTCNDSDLEHTLTPEVSPIIDFSALPLNEQIDIKMKEIMQKYEVTKYADSTTDYTSSEDTTVLNSPEKPRVTQKKKVVKIKHVTADNVSEYSSTEGEGNSKNNDSKPSVSSISSNANNSIIHHHANQNNAQRNKLSKKDHDVHVAGDSDLPTESETNSNNSNKDFKCHYCIADIDPPCFICKKEVSNKNVSFRQKCSLHMCGKFYHPDCLKMWPQTQWSIISTSKPRNSDMHFDTFVCPMHVCHTCASDDPHAAISRCSSDKVVKCLECPATYHTSNYCVPAGTVILSTSQIVCLRHFSQEIPIRGKARNTTTCTINTPWCFICSKGGHLICCEMCPTSVHTDCLQVNLLEDGTFICDDCESGRFPLYDEIVWVKLGAYRWWPGLILFPSEIPENLKNLPHLKGEFVVQFFGTYDHYWVTRGRVFLFQEGDKGHCGVIKRKVDHTFKQSIEQATAAYQLKKIFKMNKEAEINTGLKPPHYIKIKVNKPVGNVRLFDGNVSNTTSCDCDPKQASPCGPDSDCLNRLLMTECDPNICPAKERCNNQHFEKRQYAPLEPLKTSARGWGLKTLAPLRKGDFIIEYVGEVIDEQEYKRRIRKMHEQKDENYYFLTINKDRIIDAGPKGNLARFMNHCCQPNCETQKWTVNGDTRVGLFAKEDIPADTELTFNYHLECIGKEKKICRCGAPNCSGFIGLKSKVGESQKKPKKTKKLKKKRSTAPPQQESKNNGPCFICNQSGDVGACHNKICTKFYHLRCLNLEYWPEGKWVCPWHNCNICTKRTIRCCVKCLNSYCPIHSEGNVRYDKLLGFVCSEHDPTKESHEITNQNVSNAVKNSLSSSLSNTKETDVTSTTPDEVDLNPPPSTTEQEMEITINNDLEQADDDLNLTDSVTSTPIKKSKVIVDFDILKDFKNGIDSERTLTRESLSRPTKRKRRHRKRNTLHNVSAKKAKLADDDIAKPTTSYVTSNLLDIPAQNEVKLSMSIPLRHLRTTRSNLCNANTESKRFLNRQNELEKDLPIRKRSRPRCEASL